MNVAIILAGGQGSRFNDEIPKQFLILHGKRIIDYSIRTFEYSQKIDKIMLYDHGNGDDIPHKHINPGAGPENTIHFYFS